MLTQASPSTAKKPAAAGQRQASGATLATVSTQNLFVTKLPRNITDADLMSVFADYQPVSAKVMLDAATGKSKGFGFVLFKSTEDGRRAYEATNSSVVRLGSQKFTLIMFPSNHDGRAASAESNALFIRNIPMNMDPNQVHHFLMGFGQLTYCAMRRDHYGQPVWVVYAEYDSIASATSALQHLHGNSSYFSGGAPILAKYADSEEAKRERRRRRGGVRIQVGFLGMDVGNVVEVFSRNAELGPGPLVGMGAVSPNVASVTSLDLMSSNRLVIGDKFTGSAVDVGPVVLPSQGSSFEPRVMTKECPPVIGESNSEVVSEEMLPSARSKCSSGQQHCSTAPPTPRLWSDGAPPRLPSPGTPPLAVAGAVNASQGPLSFSSSTPFVLAPQRGTGTDATPVTDGVEGAGILGSSGRFDVETQLAGLLAAVAADREKGPVSPQPPRATTSIMPLVPAGASPMGGADGESKAAAGSAAMHPPAYYMPGLMMASRVVVSGAQGAPLPAPHGFTTTAPIGSLQSSEYPCAAPLSVVPPVGGPPLPSFVWSVPVGQAPLASLASSPSPQLAPVAPPYLAQAPFLMPNSTMLIPIAMMRPMSQQQSQSHYFHHPVYQPQ